MKYSLLNKNLLENGLQLYPVRSTGVRHSQEENLKENDLHTPSKSLPLLGGTDTTNLKKEHLHFFSIRL
jgi:hypothetical protein